MLIFELNKTFQSENYKEFINLSQKHYLELIDNNDYLKIMLSQLYYSYWKENNLIKALKVVCSIHELNDSESNNNNLNSKNFSLLEIFSVYNEAILLLSNNLQTKAKTILQQFINKYFGSNSVDRLEYIKINFVHKVNNNNDEEDFDETKNSEFSVIKKIIELLFCLLSSIYSYEEDFENTIKNYEIALSINNKSPLATISIAYSYMIIKNYYKAYEYFYKLILDIKSLEEHNSNNEYYETNSNDYKALYLVNIKLLKLLLNLSKINNQNSSDIHILLGSQFLKLKNFSLAKEHLNLAAEPFENKVNIQAYFELGNFYEKLGDLQSSQIFYESAIILSPNNEEPYVKIGKLLKLKDAKQCISYLNIMLQKFPTSIDLRKVLISVLLERGEIEGSYKIYSDIFLLNNKDIETNYFLAWFNLNHKNLYQSFIHAVKILENKENSPRAITILAEIYFQLNLTELALNLFIKAEKYLNNSFCNYKIGLCYFNLKEYSLARKVFTELLQETPTAREVYLNLIECSFLLNDYDHFDGISDNIINIVKRHFKSSIIEKVSPFSISKLVLDFILIRIKPKILEQRESFVDFSDEVLLGEDNNLMEYNSANTLFNFNSSIINNSNNISNIVTGKNVSFANSDAIINQNLNENNKTDHQNHNNDFNKFEENIFLLSQDYLQNYDDNILDYHTKIVIKDLDLNFKSENFEEEKNKKSINNDYNYNDTENDLAPNNTRNSDVEFYQVRDILKRISKGNLQLDFSSLAVVDAFYNNEVSNKNISNMHDNSVLNSNSRNLSLKNNFSSNKEYSLKVLELQVDCLKNFKKKLSSAEFEYYQNLIYSFNHLNETLLISDQKSQYKKHNFNKTIKTYEFSTNLINRRRSNFIEHLNSLKEANLQKTYLVFLLLTLENEYQENYCNNLINDIVNSTLQVEIKIVIYEPCNSNNTFNYNSFNLNNKNNFNFSKERVCNSSNPYSQYYYFLPSTSECFSFGESYITKSELIYLMNSDAVIYLEFLNEISDDSELLKSLYLGPVGKQYILTNKDDSRNFNSNLQNIALTKDLFIKYNLAITSKREKDRERRVIEDSHSRMNLSRSGVSDFYSRSKDSNSSYPVTVTCGLSSHNYSKYSINRMNNSFERNDIMHNNSKEKIDINKTSKDNNFLEKELLKNINSKYAFTLVGRRLIKNQSNINNCNTINKNQNILENNENLYEILVESLKDKFVIACFTPLHIISRDNIKLLYEVLKLFPTAVLILHQYDSERTDNLLNYIKQVHLNFLNCYSIKNNKYDNKSCKDANSSIYTKTEDKTSNIKIENDSILEVSLENILERIFFIPEKTTSQLLYANQISIVFEIIDKYDSCCLYDLVDSKTPFILIPNHYDTNFGIQELLDSHGNSVKRKTFMNKLINNNINNSYNTHNNYSKSIKTDSKNGNNANNTNNTKSNFNQKTSNHNNSKGSAFSALSVLSSHATTDADYFSELISTTKLISNLKQREINSNLNLSSYNLAFDQTKFNKLKCYGSIPFSFKILTEMKLPGLCFLPNYEHLNLTKFEREVFYKEFTKKVESQNLLKRNEDHGNTNNTNNNLYKMSMGNFCHNCKCAECLNKSTYFLYKPTIYKKYLCEILKRVVFVYENSETAFSIFNQFYDYNKKLLETNNLRFINWMKYLCGQ